MATIVESTTDTYTSLAGATYVLGIAGTWDGMTATLKWSDGTNDVDIQAFTADGAIEFVAPKEVIKLVTGADSTNAGSLAYTITPKK